MFKSAIPSIIFPAAIVALLQGCKLEDVPIPCTTILSIQPSAAKAGETVSILGSNFISGKPGLYKISIGKTTIPDSNIIDVTENILRFKVPVGADNGLVTITSDLVPNCQIISKDTFTYYYTVTKVNLFAGGLNSGTCSPESENCLNYPLGIDVDLRDPTNKRLIVADNFDNVIRKFPFDGSTFSTLGKWNWSTLTCAYSVPASDNVTFNGPSDLVMDDLNGDIYVTENYNSTLRVLKNGGDGPTDQAQIIAGKCEVAGGTDGPTCADALLNSPKSLSKIGNEIYFVDNNGIRRIELKNNGQCNDISTFLALPASGFAAIELSYARKGQGPVFIADIKEGRIKAIDLQKKITNLTGASFSSFNKPMAIKLDNKGNIFIAANNKIYILYTNGELISFAGSGTSGYSSGTLGEHFLDAQFNGPWGLALDEADGILFVSDTGNNIVRAIGFY